MLVYEPEQGRNERSVGEEWKVPKWAKEGMHHKRLGTTGVVRKYRCWRHKQQLHNHASVLHTR